MIIKMNTLFKLEIQSIIIITIMLALTRKQPTLIHPVRSDMNPLTPRGNCHVTSPYNINKLFSRHVMRVGKCIG